jgi:replicative DNA helicase
MKKSFLPLESKLPPQSIEEEEALLGAIMLEKDVIDNVIEIIHPNAFYKEANSCIYQAIVSLKKKVQPIDILTVTSELKKLGKLDIAGGAYYITMLTNRIVSGTNAVTHARLVMESYMKREVIRICSDKISEAYDDTTDVFELLDQVNTDFKEVADSAGIDEPIESFSALLKEAFKDKKESLAKGETMVGKPSGNPKLDQYISGFNKGNVYVLAGTSGMGKSTRLLMFAKEIAKLGEPVLIFSCEMTKRQIVEKYIIETSEILTHRYRNNQIDSIDLQKIEWGISQLERYPIFIFDKPRAQPKFIRKRCKAIRKKYGTIGMIGIDYIQLMKPDEKIQNREQEIANISGEIKAIAKEEDTPIIELSQLSKEVSKRNDKRPILDDLRESAAIGNDADAVLFVYRPEYYFDWGSHPDEQYSRENIEEADYKITSELIIGKNRFGENMITVKERFIGGYSRFTPAKEDTPDVFSDSIVYEEPPEKEGDFNQLVPF